MWPYVVVSGPHTTFLKCSGGKKDAPSSFPASTCTLVAKADRSKYTSPFGDLAIPEFLIAKFNVRQHN
jgi:hypothetical protein